MPTEKRQRQKEGQRARREAALAAARRRQRKRKFVIFGGLVVALLLVTVLANAFGGGDKKDSATSTTTTTAETCVAPNVKAKIADKPTIEKPTTPAPTEKVETTDLKVGDGAEVKAGDTIVVNYVGATYDGKEFGSTWEQGCSASGPLQEASATSPAGFIPGWVQGIPGMKVGGRRLLSIPATLAYGDSPTDGAPAGALLFIVELVDVV